MKSKALSDFTRSRMAAPIAGIAIALVLVIGITALVLSGKSGFETGAPLSEDILSNDISYNTASEIDRIKREIVGEWFLGTEEILGVDYERITFNSDGTGIDKFYHWDISEDESVYSSSESHSVFFNYLIYSEGGRTFIEIKDNEGGWSGFEPYDFKWLDGTGSGEKLEIKITENNMEFAVIDKQGGCIGGWSFMRYCIPDETTAESTAAPTTMVTKESEPIPKFSDLRGNLKR